MDDTGARHKAANGFCTQIGNAHFTWFGTTYSKSRLNFLELLRAGRDDYAINAEALAYMRHRALAAPVIARLAGHPARFFADQSLWSTHLDRLGISALKVSLDPIIVATPMGDLQSTPRRRRHLLAQGFWRMRQAKLPAAAAAPVVWIIIPMAVGTCLWSPKLPS